MGQLSEKFCSEFDARVQDITRPVAQLFEEGNLALFSRNLTSAIAAGCESAVEHASSEARDHAQSIMSEMSAHDIADHIDMSDLADHISPVSIANEVTVDHSEIELDYSEFQIDYSELEIDHSRLEIDYRALARHVRDLNGDDGKHGDYRDDPKLQQDELDAMADDGPTDADEGFARIRKADATHHLAGLQHIIANAKNGLTSEAKTIEDATNWVNEALATFTDNH